MNYWIFQCKKEKYDISSSEVLFSGMTGWWKANQYRSDMSVGDVVFFWLAGDAHYRGIYGRGEITSKPYQWQSESKKGYSVDVICSRRLDQPILATDVKSVRDLASIQILNMPMGSNFLLSKSEGLILEELFANRVKEQDHER